MILNLTGKNVTKQKNHQLQRKVRLNRKEGKVEPVATVVEALVQFPRLVADFLVKER